VKTACGRALLLYGAKRHWQQAPEGWLKKITEKAIGDITGVHEDGNVIGSHNKKHHEKNTKCAGA